jgi:predicted ATPase/class 3 adenylate cyclase
MADQPTGTVTLLFTDIEGSTRLLERLGLERYAESLDLHRRILREAFEQHGGYEVDYEGDAFFIAFSRAEDAVAAASVAQMALGEAEWLEGLEFRVRMGIHTGEPLLAPPKYVGMDVHRAARVMAAGHGGQVLVSQSTRDLVGDAFDLVDLGPYRLKDLSARERIYQLGDSEFPPLRSLNWTNLPVVSGPLIGRDDELARIRQLVADGVRLLTLTGAGGSGKTRLALQAAAELADDFRDGVFFVALAPLLEAAAVPGAVAQALGLPPDEDLAARLASARFLLVLDNAEHLDGVEHVVSELLVGEVVALVTSRAPLHLSAEHELPVEPLAAEAAAELFVVRAAATGRAVVPDETVVAVCHRLDNLPLAVELAAARTKLLSPAAILDRLDQALPLLTGGARDVPERQRTLRATIEWSHDLLGEQERTHFRRLAVFRGGFPLDAAEAVAGAGLDALAPLVDESLLKPIGDDRFLMLETLREFALERLEEAGERDEVALRHAQFFVRRLEEIAPVLRGPRTSEFLAWFDAEADNTWAALDELLASADEDAALTLAVLLAPYWIARGRMRQGVAWLETALAGTGARPAARGRALGRLGDLLDRLGRPHEAEAVLRESVAIAEAVGDLRGLAFALENLAWIEHGGGRSAAAVELGRAARAHAAAAGDVTLARSIDHDLGAFLSNTDGGLDEAQQLLERALAHRREAGDEMNVGTTLLNLGMVETARGAYAAARRHLEAALESAQRMAAQEFESSALMSLGFLDLLEHDRAGALRSYVRGLEVAVESEAEQPVLFAADGVAFAAAEVDPCAAARILGASRAVRAARGIVLNRTDQAEYGHWLQELRQLAGDEAVERELALGAGLTLDEAAELAFDLARRADANLDSP